MSDSDYEDSQYPVWLDLESDLPRNSSVDSAITTGVNVSSHSADHTHTLALIHGDSNISGPASNRGTPVGNAPLEGTGPDKGEDMFRVSNPNDLLKQVYTTPFVQP